MTDIEQQARELLAAEFRRVSWHADAEEVASGNGNEVYGPAVAAIVAALSQQRAVPEGATFLRNDFVYLDGVHYPAVVVGFPRGWFERDKFAQMLAAAPIPEQEVDRG